MSDGIVWLVDSLRREYALLAVLLPEEAGDRFDHEIATLGAALDALTNAYSEWEQVRHGAEQ